MLLVRWGVYTGLAVCATLVCSTSSSEERSHGRSLYAFTACATFSAAMMCRVEGGNERVSPYDSVSVAAARALCLPSTV